jgi:DNA-binding transcriptional ArsR family regulator
VLRERTLLCRIDDATYAFRVLGHEIRLRLVLLLAQEDSGEGYYVDELAQALGTPVGVISLHLAVLEAAGLVSGERRDDLIQYSLQREVPACVRQLGSVCVGSGQGKVVPR